MVDNDFYMKLCLNEAWKYQGLTYPNPAVGSLILNGCGKIVAIAAHHEAGTAHAELNVISQALEIFGDKNIIDIKNPAKKHTYILKNHNDLFKECTIFVTLEPCNHRGSTPPCSVLIKKLGFKQVIIGSIDPNEQATGGADLLENSSINVITGIMENECDLLIKPFKKWQENRPYIFFKLAISKNGVYTGGIISSKRSRTLTHKLREKIDLLIIGGNTVRVDRPTLDCRLSGGQAPDVLIYSHKKDFDKDIPLFKIKNRKVFISNNFEIIKNYRFIMIEGGEGMFKATKGIVDDYLIFTSPNFKVGKTIQLDMKLKSLNKDQIGIDSIEWFKKI
jgi:diaminohydroxyphosphoribosylaminopyrimidine deaminase/5-amino-6-(5-phosphoribosylamino)uracil reductase